MSAMVVTMQCTVEGEDGDIAKAQEATTYPSAQFEARIVVRWNERSSGKKCILVDKVLYLCNGYSHVQKTAILVTIQSIS